MVKQGSGAQLDLLSNDEIIALLLRAEQRVVPAVRAAVPELSAAADLVAARLGEGGRLVLVGAGTSGRLAITEAAELPGTFGLPTALIVGRMAGGGENSLAGTDFDEDDADSAHRDLTSVDVRPTDTVIAVAASGRTPYTLAFASGAVALGAVVIAVVNAPHTPLARLASVSVEVLVGEEVLRGSTRLTAGTAQKVALNALTTAAMTRFGRVHGDLMVDVVAANAKLRKRSAGIVSEIAECPADDAWQALEACDWNARAAVLRLVAGLDPVDAVAVAAAHASLREALASVGASSALWVG